MGRIPLSQVLKVSDCSIHHGGSGTCLTALEAGIPQLVLPQFDDQLENAEAVRTSGAGIRLAPEEVHPGGEKRHRTVLDDGRRNRGDGWPLSANYGPAAGLINLRAVKAEETDVRIEHMHLHQQLTRRDALRLGAAGVAVVGLATVVPSGTAAADAPVGTPVARARGSRYDDTMFDVAGVLANGWPKSPYGPDDQRGTFNELTPEHVARALAVLKPGRPVTAYQVGEEMFNGFPAYPWDPPRRHDMFLWQQGYVPPPGFNEGGGISGRASTGTPNFVSSHEERFAQNYTFQMGTQVDGLGHVGVGPHFFNGFTGPELASPTGLTALGNETMGPVVTRAVIYDVLGLKIDQGKSEDLAERTPGSVAILRDNYRVTIDDLRACLDRQRMRNGVGRGDIPIIRTGWTHLARTDPVRYIASEPGIFLAEARYFADKRVALIASDAWGLEVLDPALVGANEFPCHQELLGKHGVRIGEGFVSEAVVADGVYEGVIVITPQNVRGATAGSTPPALLANPGRRHRD